MKKAFVMALVGTSSCFCHFASAVPAAKTSVKKTVAVKKPVVSKSAAVKLPAPAKYPPTVRPVPTATGTASKKKPVLIGTFDSSAIGTDEESRKAALNLLIDEAQKQGLTAICPRDSLWWSSAGAKTVDLTPTLTAIKKTMASETETGSTANSNETNSTDAGRDAVVALRELYDSITYIPDEASYLEKVGDVKPKVAFALKALPDGNLKIHIGKAMDEFDEVATLWKNSEDSASIADYLKDSSEVMSKYGYKFVPPTANLTFDDPYKGSNYRYAYFLQPRTDIWRLAWRDVLDSEKYLNGTP